MQNLVLALVLAFLLAGCTSFQENPAAASLGITYATQKYIERDTADPAGRAARVRTVAEEALALATDDQATVAAIRRLVVASLPDDLSVADRNLANGLIAMIVQEVERRVDRGLVEGDELVTAAAILQVVINATLDYA